MIMSKSLKRASSSQSSKWRDKVAGSKSKVDPNPVPSDSSCRANQRHLCRTRVTMTSTRSKKTLRRSSFTSSNSEGCSNSTPPVQASLSPDILCGSSILPCTEKSATVGPSTPTCYGAGHLLSNMTDKRKCRPIGVLTFHESLSDGSACDNKSKDWKSPSSMRIKDDGFLLNSPIKASVHWLVNPFSKVANDNSPDFVPRTKKDEYGEQANLMNNSSFSSPRKGKKEATSYEFNQHSLSEQLSSCSLAPSDSEKGKGIDIFAQHVSPISVDSLNSDNVMQTPESDSNGKSTVLWNRSGSILNELSETAEQAPSSDQVSHWLKDQSCSSLGFDWLAQHHSTGFEDKVIENRDSMLSTTYTDSLPQSPMRISWREDLINATVDADELDCCRCFSDEEDCKVLICSDLSSHSSGDDKATQLPSTGFENTKPISCAESISTDGGSLLLSDDSDWALCYRNGLFIGSDAIKN